VIHNKCKFKQKGGLLLVIASLPLSLVALSAEEYVFWTESTREPGLVSTRIMRASTDGSEVKAILNSIPGDGPFGGIAVDVANGHLYCGSAAALFRVDLDGSCRVDLVNAINNVGDVELDLVAGDVYWTEGGGGQNAIRRARLSGSNPQTLRNIGFTGLMEGIALDLKNRKVYFQENVNIGNDTIRCMNMDGSDVRVFKTLDGPLANPHDVEIDPGKRVLYWNQTPAHGIFQTNLDDPGLDPASAMEPGPALVIPPDGTSNGFHFDHVANKFYVSGADADRIQSIKPDGSGFTTLVPGRTYVNYIEVAHMLQADYIYWTESTRIGTFSSRIMRALANGSSAETILTVGAAESPLGGIAVDVPNGHLYCGSHSWLFRVNVDGTCRGNLVPALNNVGDIELDLAGGKVYWTEGSAGQNAIRRANLDGSNVETLRNIGLAGGIEGIALDINAQTVFFSQNVNTGNDAIWLMKLNGSGASVFKTLNGPLANAHDVEIDPAKGTIYWNQAPSEGIFQTNLNGNENPGLLVAPP
jgi:hypothetical protein